jgi:hypothetical protein
MLIKLKQLSSKLDLTIKESEMKLLNKLRDLRNERSQQDSTIASYQTEAIGLGTVTVHDIVRLHNEMEIYERLYQQRIEH